VAGALQRLRANYTSPTAAFRWARSPPSPPATIRPRRLLVKDLPIEACFTSHRSNTHIPAWLNRRAGHRRRHADRGTGWASPQSGSIRAAPA